MATPSEENSPAKTGEAVDGAALGAAFGSQSAAAGETIEPNQMGPTPEQMQKFLALPDRPVVMVNLLQFKNGAGAQDYGKDTNNALWTIPRTRMNARRRASRTAEHRRHLGAHAGALHLGRKTSSFRASKASR